MRPRLLLWLALSLPAVAQGYAGLAVYIFGFLAVFCVALPALITALWLGRRRAGWSTILLSWLGGAACCLASFFAFSGLRSLVEQVFHRSVPLGVTCMVFYAASLTAVCFHFCLKNQRSTGR